VIGTTAKIDDVYMLLDIGPVDMGLLGVRKTALWTTSTLIAG
jgi:hypothetical protein